MLGDTCSAAGLADIPVEVRLSDGRRLAGTPSPQPVAGGHSVNETGYASLLLIDGVTAELEAVIEFLVRSP